MNPRITIAQLVLMFIMSTAMLAMQHGQGGNGVGVPSNGGVSQDHRHNAVNAADRTDTTGQKDSYGFRSYGQYVAATKVSEHLHISLADLKTEMVDDNLSLGQAIQKLKPSLSTQQVEAETRRAEAAAKKAEARNE